MSMRSYITLCVLFQYTASIKKHQTRRAENFYRSAPVWREFDMLMKLRPIALVMKEERNKQPQTHVGATKANMELEKDGGEDPRSRVFRGPRPPSRRHPRGLRFGFVWRTRLRDFPLSISSKFTSPSSSLPSSLSRPSTTMVSVYFGVLDVQEALGAQRVQQ